MDWGDEDGNQERNNAADSEANRRSRRGLERPRPKCIGNTDVVARMCTERIARHQLLGDTASEFWFDTAPHIDAGQLGALIVIGNLKRMFLDFKVSALGVGLRSDRHILTSPHGKGSRDKACNAGEQDGGRTRMSSGDTEHQTRGRQYAIVRTENTRAEPAAVVRAVNVRLHDRGSRARSVSVTEGEV